MLPYVYVLHINSIFTKADLLFTFLNNIFFNQVSTDLRFVFSKI